MQRTNAEVLISGWKRRPLFIDGLGRWWTHTKSWHRQPRMLRKAANGTLYFTQGGLRMYVSIRIKAQGRKINEVQSQA